MSHLTLLTRWGEGGGGDYKLSSNTSARFHRQAEVDEIKHGVWRDVFRRKEESGEVAHLLK